jgi:hypothetical protein
MFWMLVLDWLHQKIVVLGDFGLLGIGCRETSFRKLFDGRALEFDQRFANVARARFCVQKSQIPANTVSFGSRDALVGPQLGLPSLPATSGSARTTAPATRTIARFTLRVHAYRYLQSLANSAAESIRQNWPPRTG